MEATNITAAAVKKSVSVNKISAKEQSTLKELWPNAKKCLEIVQKRTKNIIVKFSIGTIITLGDSLAG